MNSPHLSKGSKQPSIPSRGRIRLYSNRFCPYAQRVRLVLDSKKISYDTTNIDISNKPDWLYDKSPYGKIPALELDNGEVLYESLIIADYLDEKYSQHPLHPKDPLLKAKDRLLIDDFSRVIRAMHRVMNGIGRINFEDSQIISNGLNLFETELANRQGPFFGGNKPGMLDLMIWPWCERADLLKLFGNQQLLKKDKYKRLMDWKKLMMHDTSVKKSLLDSNIHIKYLQSQRAGQPDCDLILNSP